MYDAYETFYDALLLSKQFKRDSWLITWPENAFIIVLFLLIAGVIFFVENWHGVPYD
jgi:hypothetical protein